MDLRKQQVVNAMKKKVSGLGDFALRELADAAIETIDRIKCLELDDDFEDEDAGSMKLYQFEIEGGFGPKLIKDNTNSQEAGNYCWKLDHCKNLFLLLHDDRLYYYIDLPDGYGWEACEGEDGPRFCIDTEE